MSAPIITEADVRMFMMDKPELNTLIDGVRWSAEEIDKAMIMVVDMYNSMSPPTGENFTIETFPFAYLLLMGTAGYLLKSASINQASNNLTYSAEGVQVNDQDKAQVFAELGGAFWKEAQAGLQQAKINANIMGAYGTKYSEYIYRAR